MSICYLGLMGRLMGQEEHRPTRATHLVQWGLRISIDHEFDRSIELQSFETTQNCRKASISHKGQGPASPPETPYAQTPPDTFEPTRTTSISTRPLYPLISPFTVLLHPIRQFCQEPTRLDSEHGYLEAPGASTRIQNRERPNGRIINDGLGKSPLARDQV